MPQIQPLKVQALITAALEENLPDDGPEILLPSDPEPEYTESSEIGATVQLVQIRHTPSPTPSGPGHTAIDEIEISLVLRTPQGQHASSSEAINVAVAQVREALSDRQLVDAVSKHVVWVHKFNVEIVSYGDQTARAIGMANLTGRGQAQAYP